MKYSLSSEVLADFLASECANAIAYDCSDALNTENFDACLFSLAKHANLTALSNVNEQDSNHAKLQLLESHDGELWLCKIRYAFLSEYHWLAINLTTGTIEKWNIHALIEKRKQFALLFEQFSIDGYFDEKQIEFFLIKPVKRYHFPLLILNLIAGLLQSAFFISIFYTLENILPLGEVNNFHHLFLLILGLLLCLFVTDYTITHLQNRFKVSLACQKNIVEQVLLWNTPPQMMYKYGSQKLASTFSELNTLAEMRWNIKQQAMSCIVLIPIIILMYIRMPFLLFALSLAVIVAYISYIIISFPTPNHSETEKLETIFKDLSILDYYQQLSSRLALWQKQSEKDKKMEIAQLQKDDTHQRWLNAIKQCSLILVMLISAFSINNATALRAVDGLQIFLLIFLVGNLINLAPRFGEIFRMSKGYRAMKKILHPILEEINQYHHIKDKENYENIALKFDNYKINRQYIDLEIKKNQSLVVKCDDEKIRKQFISQLLGLSKPLDGDIIISSTSAMHLSCLQRQSLLSFISLDSKLMEGSLKQNLFIFADKNKKSPDLERQLWLFFEILEINSMIEKLPLGLDTPITQIESSFSTGELQRLLMAQTLMKKAKILVIDNALFGLLEEQESRIIQKLMPYFDILVCTTLRNSLRQHATHWLEINCNIKNKTEKSSELELEEAPLC